MEKVMQKRDGGRSTPTKLHYWETDFDPYWLTEAKRLVDQMEELFLDASEWVYFYEGQDQKTPLGRNRSIHDQSIPSGNSMAALACWKLYRFTEERSGPGGKGLPAAAGPVPGSRSPGRPRPG